MFCSGSSPCPVLKSPGSSVPKAQATPASRIFRIGWTSYDSTDRHNQFDVGQTSRSTFRSQHSFVVRRHDAVPYALRPELLRRVPDPIGSALGVHLSGVDRDVHPGVARASEEQREGLGRELDLVVGQVHAAEIISVVYEEVHDRRCVL